jgi:hypothetical protein
MFATHPLRELEGNKSSNAAKYLTYYTFMDDLNQPTNLSGASADDVQKMITFLEEQVVQGVTSPPPEIIEQVKLAGKAISKWVEGSFRLGNNDFNDFDDFGDESGYFVPVPVALVAIINTDTQISEDEIIAAQEKFTELASQWTKDVEDMSSTVEMVKHPAYQEIINMGKAVIPLMLKDLSQNPLYWLTALRQITQENPVPPEHKGKVKQMAEDWLNWGKEQGYLA